MRCELPLGARFPDPPLPRSHTRPCSCCQANTLLVLCRPLIKDDPHFPSCAPAPDRTPKQKLKVVITQEPLLALFHRHKDAKGKQAKLKSPLQLQELLDTTRQLVKVSCGVQARGIGWVTQVRQVGASAACSRWAARRHAAIDSGGRGRAPIRCKTVWQPNSLQ